MASRLRSELPSKIENLANVASSGTWPGIPMVGPPKCVLLILSRLDAIKIAPLSLSLVPSCSTKIFLSTRIENYLFSSPPAFSAYQFIREIWNLLSLFVVELHVKSEAVLLSTCQSDSPSTGEFCNWRIKMKLKN